MKLRVSLMSDDEQQQPPKSNRITAEELGALVDAANEAIHAIGRTFAHWVVIGRAYAGARQFILQKLDVDTPADAGGKYSDEMSKWLSDHPLIGNINSGDLNRLLWVIENLPMVEAWRGTLNPTDRANINHPSSIFRKIGPKKKKPGVRRDDPRDTEILKLRDELGGAYAAIAEDKQTISDQQQCIDRLRQDRKTDAEWDAAERTPEKTQIMDPAGNVVARFRDEADADAYLKQQRIIDELTKRAEAAEAMLAMLTTKRPPGRPPNPEVYGPPMPPRPRGRPPKVKPADNSESVIAMPDRSEAA
jgi:hypothetical protein